jgi:MscS family membrane protein
MHHRSSRSHLPSLLDRAWISIAIAAFLLLLASFAAPRVQGGEPARDEPLPEQIANETNPPVYIARTDSPRATLSSFVHLRAQLETAAWAYWEKHDRSSAERALLIADEFTSLIDLSEVPAASRRAIGAETVGYLLDIFDRIPLPNLEEVPDIADTGADGPAAYAIPDTPFRIVRIDGGPRAGEFLFSSRTAQSAARIYPAFSNRPLKTSLPIKSWTTAFREFTGPLIPTQLIAAMPEPLSKPVLGTPIWKILLVAMITLPTTVILIWWHRHIVSGGRGSRSDQFWRHLLSALSCIAALLGIRAFILEVNPSGLFSEALDTTGTLLIFLAIAWAFWILAVGGLEKIIRRKELSEATLDSNMVRLLARIIGLVGGIIILSFGAQELGLPVFSIFAGLGIGGLAIALAVRPTLENLIAGFVLYLDQPIRVGDFCTFGESSGTVESIGVRSIQIRALDRTLISVPNAQFADMQIVNWARCDQMLITQTICLRSETDADQLRHVLVKIREMFHAHPRIDSETVRVRFVGYGASSLDIDIRVYARTHEWNDFYAIREDVLFRLKDIVEASGTGFAFPSQTLYLGRDGGLNTELGKKAKEEVARWRRIGQLPFPRLPASRINELAGRLKYPPLGSPDFNASEEDLAEPGGEHLSAEPRPNEASSEKTPIPTLAT